jgi:hypothetical protein
MYYGSSFHFNLRSNINDGSEVAADSGQRQLLAGLVVAHGNKLCSFHSSASAYLKVNI